MRTSNLTFLTVVWQQLFVTQLDKDLLQYYAVVILVSFAFHLHFDLKHNSFRNTN